MSPVRYYAVYEHVHAQSPSATDTADPLTRPRSKACKVLVFGIREPKDNLYKAGNGHEKQPDFAFSRSSCWITQPFCPSAKISLSYIIFSSILKKVVRFENQVEEILQSVQMSKVHVQRTQARMEKTFFSPSISISIGLIDLVFSTFVLQSCLSCLCVHVQMYSTTSSANTIMIDLENREKVISNRALSCKIQYEIPTSAGILVKTL
jgi:hypothetical protein